MTTVTIKERPILFSGPMVRAILAGRKTQTRRVAKLEPIDPGLNFAFSGLSPDDQGARGFVLSSRGKGGCWNERTKPKLCPYGKAGERLWVRETWRPHPDGQLGKIIYRADAPDDDSKKWKPSLFMRRWASRLVVEVLKVRLERLQEISEADAIAEGILAETLPPDPDNFHPPGSYGYVTGMEPFPKGSIYPRAQEAYRDLWDKINAEGGNEWSSNPWVWVIEFRRVEA